MLTDGLPLLVGVWNFKKINYQLKPFIYFLYFVALQNAFSIMIVEKNHYNIWWCNIYAYIECIFYVSTFHVWIFEKKFRRALLALLLTLTVIFIYNYFFVYGKQQANNFFRVLASILVMLYSMRVLIMISRQSLPPLFRNPAFWITSGTLCFFTFTLMVFSVFPLIMHNNYIRELYEPVWALMSSVNIFSNLLFSTAFLCPLPVLNYPPTKLYLRL